MRIMALFFTLIVISSFKTNELNLEDIRMNYQSAVTNKELCHSMIEQLSINLESNVYLAYYGAFQTIWANHTANPFEKLKTFKEGKINIEKAVKSSPANIEIIFIRYSIQKESPSFLGYKDNLKADKAFLFEHFKEIKSPFLKNMVKKILILK